ncbi:hypothetical protein BDV12DRAFT_190004 [Aspergillus spectabilis]
MRWQTAAQAVREALQASIPQTWKLQPSHKDGLQDVTKVPGTCGLLSEQDPSITDLDASTLVDKIARGELTATRVTEAFCARAAIAHQLKALERVRELDEHLKMTGKPVGPLHGLPIALKDSYDVPGHATTWGYAFNTSHRATRESASPQAGLLLETVSNLYGRTLDPRDTTFGAGGSSGGDGALVALKGRPMTPSTDIGGSIRAPAAFNGLYGIRLTADQVPKRGMKSVESGQLNIRVSCGPVANSLADARYDPTCIPVPWREVDLQGEKLAFGLWEWDGAVMPHPPIIRAMRETAEKLKEAGHEVIPVKMPYDCWEASQVYMDIYYQYGNEDSAVLLAKAGENIMPAYHKMLDVYKVPQIPIDAKQLLKLIQTQSKYRELLAEAWDATSSQTKTGRSIGGIICPVSSVAGYPHDFLPWWGYTSLFNLVDYPSTVIPVKGFKITPEKDPKDEGYIPQDNYFDRSCQNIYDPLRWANMPVCVQIVARPFDDEELIAVTEVLDGVINGKTE